MSRNRVGASDCYMGVAGANDVFSDSIFSATSTVEISIACRDLTNKDILSKSDPMCVIYHKPIKSNTWIELLRTEVISNNLNPDFVTKLTLMYRFETAQHLMFKIYDVDSPKDSLDTHDLIGSAECTAAAILSAGSAGFSQDLKAPNNDNFCGIIILTAEELASMKTEVFLRLSGNGVGSCWTTCLMPKTFYTISKINDTHNFILVFRSKKRKGIHPQWPDVTLGGQTLCNGDLERQLKIQVYRINLHGEDHFIGSAFTSLKQMTSRQPEYVIQLAGKNGEPLKTSLTVRTCSITPIFTFVDYVQAGTRLNLCFCIDFTASNGNPKDPNSLHYISNDSTVLNPYEQAIEAAGSVCQYYDDDGVFPVYGFGAIVPPANVQSDDFHVTLSDSPNCKGIHGIINAYRRCIERVKLSGPKNFAPIINRVTSMASMSRPGQHYFILLIITDGIITDALATKEAIVKAAIFPLSIIIVGVGDADFTAMRDLDGDEETVSFEGKYAERDIVQFVEYRNADHWLKKFVETFEQTADSDFKKMDEQSRKRMTRLLAQSKLSEEILAEIPDQFISYMQSRGIEPAMVIP